MSGIDNTEKVLEFYRSKIGGEIMNETHRAACIEVAGLLLDRNALSSKFSELAAKDAEIARLTSANAELRRLGDELFSALEDADKTNAISLGNGCGSWYQNTILQNAIDATLEAWKASKA